MHTDAHHRPSGAASILASAFAGFAELVVFHPIDTISKRLMNNRDVVTPEGDKLRTVIYGEAAKRGALAQYKSLFPGFQYAVTYKVLQRSYQFGGQPFVVNWLERRWGSWFKAKFRKRAQTAVQATAGLVIGMGEVVLLPLDALKVKGQTNPSLLHGTSPWALLVRPSSLRKLYSGAGWTAARNMVGCFALFGASAAAKDIIYDLNEGKEKATLMQTLVASFCGAIASIALASPFDVIKVRVQAAPAEARVSGFAIARNIIRLEGMRAFGKGLVPKLLAAGPKITFSFTIAQQLSSFFSAHINSQPPALRAL
ncbi:uncharacterized protein SPPG_01778 [Spizellomyces punctatus DAOM BR117]|uniref:Mitochondrial carrier protein n=1 Tax=Spizellomyces punctatus (strain DAOM BR117) TaxID=645134 RepID=A0A0L0HNR1_SPIPD|nr:uncharacterized protein SPPG_01778 [Spizellomyces punctatus DAOM BR117]KND02693.1 hypothetical protein SPPG_01778 [Spizellomyces punctatus DAOM BR117]|eukprot:XP_016610732.1 hypothetical protein SPPG_01778 [Spizellomyces punctatus DAOM BR117]